MTLNQTPSYPISGGYVLKLHRDARPQQGLLHGRLEHIASGDSAEFADAQGLWSWLAQHAARLHAAAPTANTPADTDTRTTP
jgi:hypothetical protein